MTNAKPAAPVATAAAKMMFLIKRKPTTSREELIAHWFANHMPIVIERQKKLAEQGRSAARRYLVTLFQPNSRGEHAWDGVAQLWWDRPLPRPDKPFGDPPSDSFQAKALPYVPWGTREYVIVDDAGRLSSAPQQLNAPYPTSRSGFHKRTFLVKAKAGTDYDELFAHWLGVHVPNVIATLKKADGFRYVVSHSLQPKDEPFAGMAELYFPNESAWAHFSKELKPDGMEKWLDMAGMLIFSSDTEFVGIP